MEHGIPTFYKDIMMTLKTSKLEVGSRNENAPTLEPGSYPARLVQVIDLGVHPQPDFQGDAKPPKPMIMLTYELVDQFMQDEEGNDIKDRPRWISEQLPLFPLYSERAKSTKRYAVMDVNGTHSGDFAALLNSPVLVNIVNNPNKKDPTKVWENVGNVTLMRASEVKKLPPLVNEPKAFDMDEPDLEVFNSLPDWIKDKITNSLEFGSSELNEALGGEPATMVDELLDDEIPF